MANESARPTRRLPEPPAVSAAFGLFDSEFIG